MADGRQTVKGRRRVLEHDVFGVDDRVHSVDTLILYMLQLVS
jgi:hypothetical protein